VNHTFADMHEQKLHNSTNPFINRLHGDAAEADADLAAPASAPIKAPATVAAKQ
jgi:hypothetical protein